jgi:hypothetical protein
MGTIVVVRFVAILWRLELPVLSLEQTHTGTFPPAGSSLAKREFLQPV